MNRDRIESVVRSLRRVNLQGSLFGQTVAIRFGLSESDVETLEALIEMGASTAGKLADLTGLTSGAVTRVIDRLEQAGYVRRVPDPDDRRKVIVEVVPDKVEAIQSTLDRVGAASVEEIGRYTDAQLALITEFLGRMEQITRAEATSLREHAEGPGETAPPSEHAAPLGGLAEARLLVRAGLAELRLRSGAPATDLYRGRFEGPTPQVRLRDGRVIVQYRGAPFDWRKRKAAFDLNATIPWSFEVVGGIERLEADLRDVLVERFVLTGGSQRIDLALGQPRDEVQVQVVGGAHTIRIDRPAGVPVRLRVSGGSRRIELDGRALSQRGGEIALDSVRWTGRGARYTIEIVGGSQRIEITAR
jgi:DNA-binding MarR family transcriptional regulator